MIATLAWIWVITCWVKETKNENWSILMSSQHITLLLMSRDLQSRRSSFSPFKHIYYFQFLIFEIIRFIVWFYVLGVILLRLLNSLIFVSQFVFKNYWSFCSAEFNLLLLFSEFLITVLFVIYFSPSMFAQSQLRSFSSVILSKCWNIFIVYIILEIVFAVGNWFIKVHLSL